MKIGESVGSLVRTSTPPEYRLTGTGKNKKAKYELRCDKDLGGCGRLIWRDAENLRKGRTKSCNEPDCPASKRFTQGGLTRPDGRGGKKDPIYQCWDDMLARCYDAPRPDDDPPHRGSDSYKNYGAKGIGVCAEWRFGCVVNGVQLTGYQVFRQFALAHGHAPGMQIHRPRSDKDYGPNNAEFVTRKVNVNARDCSHREKAFGGEEKTLAEWAEDPRCAVSYDTLKRRFQRRSFSGNVEAMITTPVGKEDD